MEGTQGLVREHTGQLVSVLVGFLGLVSCCPGKQYGHEEENPVEKVHG